MRGHINASDPGGGALGYAGSATDAKGTFTINDDGTYVFTPTDAARHDAAADGAGDNATKASYVVSVTTPRGATTTVTVKVDITPLNADPQRTTLPSVTSPSNGVVTGAFGVTDDDNDQLSYAINDGDGPAKGTVTFNPADGTFTYTPTTAARSAAATTTGPDTDTFTVTITDGHGGQTTSTVTVAVTPTGVIGQVDFADDGNPSTLQLVSDGKLAAVISDDAARTHHHHHAHRLRDRPADRSTGHHGGREREQVRRNWRPRVQLHR